MRINAPGTRIGDAWDAVSPTGEVNAEQYERITAQPYGEWTASDKMFVSQHESRLAYMSGVETDESQAWESLVSALTAAMDKAATLTAPQRKIPRALLNTNMDRADLRPDFEVMLTLRDDRALIFSMDRLGGAVTFKLGSASTAPSITLSEAALPVLAAIFRGMPDHVFTVIRDSASATSSAIRQLDSAGKKAIRAAKLEAGRSSNQARNVSDYVDVTGKMV